MNKAQTTHNLEEYNTLVTHPSTEHVGPMWKEDSETVMIVEGRKKKKPTTPAVRRRSPIQVLNRPNTA